MSTESVVTASRDETGAPGIVAKTQPRGIVELVLSACRIESTHSDGIRIQSGPFIESADKK